MDFSLVGDFNIREGRVMKIDIDNETVWQKSTKKFSDEYQKLDYITLSGTQFFIYEQPLVNNMEIQMEFSVSQFGQIMYMAGTYCKNKPIRAFLTPVLSGSAGRLSCYSGTEEPGSQFARDFITNQKYSLSVQTDISKSLQTAILSGADIESPITVTSNITASISELYKFGIGLNGYLALFGTQEQSTYGLRGNLYSFKHFSGGILVRDFIPCKRLSDNVVGLYDLVHEEFFANQGEGEVIAGPDDNNLIYFGTIRPGGLYLYGQEGYKDGPRWTHSGEAVVPDFKTGRLTGWMPYKKGTLLVKNFDIDRTSGDSYVNGCYIVYYHNDDTITVLISGKTTEDEYTTELNDDTVLYFRVSGHRYNNGDKSVSLPLPIITIT